MDVEELHKTLNHYKLVYCFTCCIKQYILRVDIAYFLNISRFKLLSLFTSLQGLVLLSLSTQEFMLQPEGCGKIGNVCNEPSAAKVASFYVSIYLLALGSGAIEPALATLGADQFDEEDPEENKSKSAFFSYYYVALNLGSLIAETVLVYIENLGKWVLAFWISTSCGLFALVFLIGGTSRYRHTRPSSNPISRFSQVIVASVKKFKLDLSSHGDELYEVPSNDEKERARRISHTDDFK